MAFLTPPELNAVLLRVGTGDVLAFNILYAATYAKLLSVSRNVVGDRDLAEEVVQEAYATIWIKAGGFDLAKGTAIAWLATVVRHRAVDELRSRSRRRKTTGLKDAEDVADGALPACEEMKRKEHIARLDRGLEGLALHQQTAIRRAFYDDLTYLEVAAEAGVPHGTMKSWIRRGIGALRQEMEDSRS